MKLKSVECIVIACNICSKEQKFCITGTPISGMCTLCRKKQWKKSNPEIKKPECFCKSCSQKVGKNNKTLLCRKCRLISKKDELTEYSRQYCKKRYKDDLLFMISKRLRSRLSHAIRELAIQNKQVSSIKHLGCSPLELKIYLESKFVPGMTWNNYGKWHIDHRIPLSSAKIEQDLYELVFYTNLQPMWAIDNLKKGNKIVNPVAT